MPTSLSEKRQNAKECKQIVKEIEVIMATKMEEKHRRAEQVNQVIRIIADHGRRFFYHARTDNYASMYVDGFGKIWFVDSYTATPTRQRGEGAGRVFQKAARCAHWSRNFETISAPAYLCIAASWALSASTTPTSGVTTRQG
ncbi:hypothetical protein V0M98_34695 (plasmid) [Pseudomonas silesiensis]|uniref:hypothetical protein n=1 Tax=Pseudomonas silesiensis TaxID=1853130 RepID=UPI0030D38FB3